MDSPDKASQLPDTYDKTFKISSHHPSAQPKEVMEKAVVCLSQPQMVRERAIMSQT